MKRALLLVTVIALAWGPAPGLHAQSVPGMGSETVFRALQDEMKRTMKRLDMENLGLPYFVGYTVRDVRRVEVEASFGALRDAADRRSRRLSVDLRVGTRDFDNTHYIGATFWRFGPTTESLVTGDDYDALRYGIWSATDQAYKTAQETLSKKKAYKQRRLIKDEIPDLSQDPVAASFSKPVDLPFDRTLWEDHIRRISAVFRRYPAIQSSQASLFFSQQHTYFVDSQSREVHKNDHDVEVYISARTQAPDGMKLSDRRRIIRKDTASLPSFKELEAEAEALAKDLSALAASPLWEEPYTGPVLLEGQAAGEFFDQLLARNLCFPRELWLENEERIKKEFHSGALAGRLGLRVVSPILSAYDDPGLQSLDGMPLAGHFKVDDEGVRAQRVDVISKGILKDLLMSRSPTKKRSLSNGHGRGGLGEVVTAHLGNLILSSDKTAGPKELKADLLKRAQEFGLDHAVIIRRLQTEAEREEDDALAPPTLVYKVSVKDGKETLYRNAQFTSVTLRALRDIVLTGEARHVYNYYQLGPYRYSRSEVPATIVHPDILVAELELKKSDKKPEKPPVLKHPHFAKKK